MADNLDMKAEFKAVSFRNGFPLTLIKQKKQEIDEDEKKKTDFDPNAINLKMEQLVWMVHGSIDPKPKIIDDFNEQHPECSKNSIERKLKECFVKDKRGDDPRLRYYASDECLATIIEAFPNGKENEELVSLAQQRIQPILDELKQQQLEAEEAKRKEQEEKERERQEREKQREEEAQIKEMKRQEEKLLKEIEKSKQRQKIEEERE